MAIKYELKFKTKGLAWKVFNTYKTADDPDIEKYSRLLRNMRFNDGVKLIKVETIREEVKI